MHFPALLYTCILSMIGLMDGIPVHQDTLKNVIKMQADTIIHRIKEHKEKLRFPDIVIDNTELKALADKPIQGLGSIMDTLTTIQKVLQKLPKGHVSQICVDVSTLLGFLKDRMTFMRCTHKEPTNGKSLDAFLEANATNHVTLGYVALDGLKQFMQNLIGNLDHLRSC
uniref:Leptin n=1 Tax=Tanichthys albonubes TaxID=38762 RepID=A0A0C5CLA1_TANAL|nr:leptin-a [Tanichthys albonubes]